MTVADLWYKHVCCVILKIIIKSRGKATGVILVHTLC